MRVSCLNNISSVGLNHFTSNYQIVEDQNQSELILVRSAKMHEYPINDNLLAVARAGAGVNNIPLDKMAQAGVVVFNTPGANSNAVKELVVAGMLIASRDLIGGFNWVKENKNDPDLQKNVEKAKKAYGGNEILGKTLLVVGLGAIGGKVANTGVSLGMKVLGFDPYLSENARRMLDHNVEIIEDLYKVYGDADFISLHLPLLDSTKNFMNKEVFDRCKDNVIVLNFARDLLVDNQALKDALSSGKVKKYVTDFPDSFVANLENVIYLPHLGASTEESEENCATMAVHQLMSYVEKGEINNSVNFPNISLDKLETETRLTILAKNDPDIARHIDSLMHKLSHAIKSKVSKVRGDYAYYVFDIDKKMPEDILSKLSQYEGVFKVRIV
ncbi:3-phosphoglycerate dehydrogenase family protein [Hujiaoplasma nucleasis]|nr:3-phosphoglycerate dehydrogenase family protein [Hujiaoplasma nucleasis]